MFMQNSDLYTEFSYKADFQRYRGHGLCKIVLYVLMKQAETYLLTVEAYDFPRYMASGIYLFSVQQ